MYYQYIADSSLLIAILVSALVPVLTGRPVPAGLLIAVSGLLPVPASHAHAMHKRGRVESAGKQ